ncbi:hypothetical protein MTO98_25305 [Mucilaginibacter sp. SMC90]|uniref:hypothetical protein n=1 Tax=Mucilaginibacter sp. SMC90 TaxID=2929803 RepID=UPI001FB2C83B|nr:hypothetical protein [Mucilaginibacter sp. SMC90]UOE47733.1 hypothetical protein MTO98_25305 [Mucilaginibacter sp. SMC90]
MNNRQAQNQSPAAIVKTLSIIHMALVAGQTLFAAVTFIIPKNPVKSAGNDMLVYIVPIFAVSCFIASHMLFLKLLGNIKSDATLKAKLMAYQSATIVRLALLEGPSLFAIVGFLLTGKLILIGISVVLIAYFIYLRPSRQKIEDDLTLGYEEKAELDGTGKAY